MPLGISGQLLDLLEAHPWEETIPRLLAHASSKSKRLFWKGIYGGPLPEGNEVEDLVYQAIEKVLTGQRQWDPTTSPDLFLFLKGVVDSSLSHLARSWENRYVRKETTSVAATDNAEDEHGTGIIDCVPATASNPEEMLLQQEDEARCEELFLIIFDSLEDEPLLQKILECLLDDVEKPADIAEKLSVPVKEIYNARKKLQRRLADHCRRNEL